MLVKNHTSCRSI